MIKKFVDNSILNTRPTQSVTAAAVIISLAGIASRLLGLLRDRILASQFGAGDILDAYYAAFRIPDLVYNLLILGALSAAFIPVFTKLVSHDKEEQAWKMASGVLIIQMVVMIAVSLVLVIIAPWLMHVITPGFSDGKMDLVVSLTRIMFLSPILLGISGIFGGMLVSFKKFLIYSLAPITYNIGIIIGALWFVKPLGPIGLAWGVVLGAFLHMLIQYPAVKTSGFKLIPQFLAPFQDKNVREVLTLMVPRTLSIAISQINFLVITIVASTLAAGSLAVFNLANNIQSAPLGLFGVSFAIAVFPTLSALSAKDANEQFIKLFSKTLRQILFFVIPISALILVLRAQIVRVLLGSGKFDWDDTRMTLNTLGFLAISLFAQSLIPLLTRSFYAIHNTKIPFYIALVSEAVNIIAVIVLVKPFNVIGLAIAFSLANIVNMTLLIIFLRRKLGNLDESVVWSATRKIVIASLLAGLSAQAVKYLIGTKGELDTFLAVLAQLVIAGGTGIAVFSLVSYHLKSEEFFQFTNSVTRKLFKAKKSIQEDTTEVAGI